MGKSNLTDKTDIALEDCRFYSVQDVPGLSEPTKGEWDLRENIDKYLGNVDFKDKTVLELGPASGCLTFEIENQGIYTQMFAREQFQLKNAITNNIFLTKLEY